MVESLNEFKLRWLKKCEEIKKLELDRQQCYHLAKDFSSEWEAFGLTKGFNQWEIMTEINKVQTDVNIALETAFSNYRKRHKKWWSIFSGIRNVNINFFSKHI